MNAGIQETINDEKLRNHQDESVIKKRDYVQTHDVAVDIQAFVRFVLVS